MPPRYKVNKEKFILSSAQDIYFWVANCDEEKLGEFDTWRQGQSRFCFEKICKPTNLFICKSPSYQFIVYLGPLFLIEFHVIIVTQCENCNFMNFTTQKKWYASIITINLSFLTVSSILVNVLIDCRTTFGGRIALTNCCRLCISVTSSWFRDFSSLLLHELNQISGFWTILKDDQRGNVSNFNLTSHICRYVCRAHITSWIKGNKISWASLYWCTNKQAKDCVICKIKPAQGEQPIQEKR